MMKSLIAIVLLAGIPQAPPIVAGIDLDESDHRDRIEAAWDAAGIPTVAEVHTPTGGRCDLVTDRYAWEIDFAEKWAEGVGQAAYYGVDLDRDAGLLLLVGPGEDRFITRAELACHRAGVRLLVVPLSGEVPLPANETSPGGSINEPTAAASLGTSPEARGESIPEVRELVVIGATWCQACRSVPHDVPGTRYLDLDRDRAEIVRLYGAIPPQIPAYTLVVDGRGVKNWYGATGVEGIKTMRDWQPSEPARGHLVDDPLSDAIANYHGPSAPTTRQRLKADYGYTHTDLRYLSQGELERLQGAINSGAIKPPRR